VSSRTCHGEGDLKRRGEELLQEMRHWEKSSPGALFTTGEKEIVLNHEKRKRFSCVGEAHPEC